MKNYLSILLSKLIGLLNKEEVVKCQESITTEQKPEEITILLGTDLAEFGYDFVNVLKSLRQEMKDENGFVLPIGKIREEFFLQENEYQIFIRGNLKYNGFAIPNKKYALSEIKNSLYRVCKENLYDIFSTKMTERYINNFLDNENWILKNTILEFFTITSIKKILVYLLENGQSIKDGEFIFEKMCEYASLEKDRYFFRNPMPIAKNILEDLSQRNEKTEAEEIILEY